MADQTETTRYTRFNFPEDPGRYSFSCTQTDAHTLRVTMDNQEGGSVSYFLTGDQEGELRDFLNRRFESLSS